jgi:hypothetical protein
MSRRSVHTNKIARVRDLANKGFTIAAACKKVGIAPSTYFVHRRNSEEPRFPALDREWDALARNYEPQELGNLDNRGHLSLARAVGETFRTIFSRPVHGLTPRQRSRQLGKLLARSTALINTFDSLGYDTLSELSLLSEEDDLNGQGLIEPAIERIRVYAVVIDRKVRDLAAVGPMKMSDSGGPRPDPRIYTATMRLTNIFTRHSGQLPTHRTDPASGKVNSRYNHFVRHAFSRRSHASQTCITRCHAAILSPT